jgi:hypothetical protein
MTLVDLVRSDTKIQDIANHLDELSQAERLHQVYALSATDQARLYDRAADAPPLDLDYFVPTGVPAGKEVIHHGKNSQPVFRHFQKRWCRPEGRPGELWGYNETAVRPVIGPGYFVARTTGSDGGDVRGAVVVDYFEVPDGPAPVGWPAIKPNSKGLQMFVYDKTRDYMRRVSRHVSIGKAYRKESRVMGYFVLCRDDAASDPD